MTRRGLFGSAPSYDTPLTLPQQGAYQQWRTALPGELQNSGDYDLQGAYLAAAQADGRLHMTDQFKKPNHMTFSDGSQYSTPQTPGGHWSDSGIPNPYDPDHGNRYVFWASPYNLQQHPLGVLGQYFNDWEKGNSMVAPIDYRLPPR